MPRSIEARVAESVWQGILEWERTRQGQLPEFRKNFRNRSQDFPRCMRQNGLTLAVTFFAGKGGLRGLAAGGREDQDLECHGAYLRCLARVLADPSMQERTGVRPDARSSAVEALLSRCLSSPVREYRELTELAAMAALWFKRLAEARWTDPA
ncbi:type III-B CRISPR module-associated protein Cmr5 [Myxococcota bacterium]|nr:type III-B CRISPR module-associated protein Cmr5 [Myxococcota bacterium]